MKTIFKNLWALLYETIAEFIEDDCLKLSASLSYYTIFSIPPLLIIIISLFGIFFGAEAIRGEIYGQINGLIGNQAALQVQDIIIHINQSEHSAYANIIGVIILLYGSTRAFAEMQSSLNFIWRLDAKPKRRFLKFLENRILTFSMLAVLGFLFLVSLLVNTLMDVLSARIILLFPNLSSTLYYVNHLIIFFLVALLFTLIFKTLPDGKISWKDTFIGAAASSFLFMSGKFGISAYLSKSELTSVYGAAGSIIVVLVWVYYSAIILYLGAELTKVYAHAHGDKIIPNEYAVEVEKLVIEKEAEETDTSEP